MIPLWIPTIILGHPKRDHNFDNHPYPSRTLRPWEKSEPSLLVPKMLRRRRGLLELQEPSGEFGNSSSFLPSFTSIAIITRSIISIMCIITIIPIVAIITSITTNTNITIELLFLLLLLEILDITLGH